MTEAKKTLEEQLQLLSERSRELGFIDPVQYLCSKAKEVRQTEDSFEAIRLISTWSWAVASGFVQDGKPNWILVRYA